MLSTASHARPFVPGLRFAGCVDTKHSSRPSMRARGCAKACAPALDASSVRRGGARGAAAELLPRGAEGCKGRFER
eukprot:232741-Pleurochrysis_carterae.AAC.5